MDNLSNCRRRSRASSTSSRVSHSQPQPPGQFQSQPLEAPKIIIIHPGSQHLRIGRAADLNPLTMLHAVAYRRREENGGRDGPHHDPLLPPLDTANLAKLQLEFEEHRLSVSRILQHCIVDEQNRLRVATPPQQLAHFNRSSVAEKIPSPISEEEYNNWNSEDTESSVLVANSMCMGEWGDPSRRHCRTWRRSGHMHWSNVWAYHSVI
ncbi:hypothetical protein ACLKA6_005394 [Drosophila palustris]